MNAFTSTQTSTQVPPHSWWMLGIRGVFAVLFGLTALFLPLLALFAVVIFFGAYFLVDGMMAVVAAVQGRKNFRMWWLLLLEGLVGVAIGLMTFFWPGRTALVLFYFVASWAIVTGIFEIGAAFSGWSRIGHEWTIALAGIVSIILGIFLFARPVAGLLALVWSVGIYAIVFGVLLIVRAFQSRPTAQSSVAGNV